MQNWTDVGAVPRVRWAQGECVMWFFTVLALGLSGALWMGSRTWRNTRSGDLGWMSHTWLEEHRAGER